MPFTAADVILAARDLNPAFTAQRHPDPVCLRFLSRYVRTLTAAIMAKRPRALAVTVTTVPLPLPNFAIGVEVPADLLLVEVRVRPSVRNDDAFRRPVELIPGGQALAGHTRVPYGWREGNRVFLGGKADQWTAYDLLELRTIAMPASVTLGATIPFPDDALDVFCAQLGAFMARRHAEGPETTRFSPAALNAEAAAAEASYIERLTTQMRAEVWTMRRMRD
jgi:hypothetical protein